ncbi:MAG TPA: histidine kinase, partial [Puia sp.]|nr:histidine kinase [Puia sp.]
MTLSAVLLYSPQRRHRLTRHLVLWVLYAGYFTMQSYFPTGRVTGISSHFTRIALLSTAAYFPFCFLAAYLLLYYLYPRFLQRGQVLRFLLAFGALFLLGIVINAFAGVFFYRFSGREKVGLGARMGLGFHNTTIALITGLFILGLRLGRNAWLQRAANLRLAAQKARAELQLLKTRVDPDFLFTTLDRLRAKVDSGDPGAPAAILQLSETLSGILYEGEGELAFTANELPRYSQEESVFRQPAT